MARFSVYLFKAILALVIPMTFFLLFWWSSLFFTGNEKTIEIFAFVGIGLGLLIDVFIGIFWKRSVYALPKRLIVIVYLFYCFGMLGFFMGVPLFHPILGALAGYFWAERIIYLKTFGGTIKAEIRTVSVFTAAMMGLISALSATFALLDKYTANNIEGMFNLSFDISMPVLIISILVGGIFLILLQYWLTRLIMRRTLKPYLQNI